MKNNSYFKTLKLAISLGDELTRGQRRAYRAWQDTVENNCDAFEVHELPWGREVEDGAMLDFAGCIRSAGIKRFVVTDTSSALMTGIHALCATGCTIVGPAVVKRCSPWGDGVEERAGIEFMAN